MLPSSLSQGQFDTVYNLVSLAIAALLFTGLFLVFVQPRVLPRYRQALVVGAIVCGIAAYHYFRIFTSFQEAYVNNAPGGAGDYVPAIGRSFNEGYRYVDWLLTVPLLLVELVAVLALARKVQSSLLTRLIPAAALMIVLGYPGEASSDTLTRVIFGGLSTIPFLYILYVLFVELTRSLERQSPEVRKTVNKLRLLLFATWGVYPLAYLIPTVGLNSAGAWVVKQAGYSIADILAKALYGLLIFQVARLKSLEEDPTFSQVEIRAEDQGPDGPTSTPSTTSNGDGTPVVAQT